MWNEVHTQNTSMRDGIQFSTENTYTLSTNCCMSKTLTSLCKRIYLTYAGVSQSKKTMKLNIVRGHGLILYIILCKITFKHLVEKTGIISAVCVSVVSLDKLKIDLSTFWIRVFLHVLHVNCRLMPARIVIIYNNHNFICT